MRKRLVTMTARLLLALVVLAAAGAAGVYVYLRQSLPATRGTRPVEGLHAEVRVVRDRHGVPHVYAGGFADAAFALGYVHAQDRLWQMEVNRRTGAGRLSEVFGAASLGADRFLRTLGLRRAAEASYDRLDGATRGILDAYTRGVNALLADPGVTLPPEFVLTGVAPEPWTPADSLSWMKVMAWNNAGNWREELLRLTLSQRLGSPRLAELFPPYPGDPPIVLPDLRAVYSSLAPSAATLLAGDPLAADRGGGSNNWVVAGDLTASGKPLLANDPHLRLTSPSIWYLVHLHLDDGTGPARDIVGGTLPGLPAVVLGHNGRIAWGYTNTRPDTQDLFIERLDPGDPDRYLSATGPRPFVRRTETIRVKGEEAVRLEVLETHHGPVISDVVRGGAGATPEGYVLALAWVGLRSDDATFRAAIRLSLATDWASFTEAVRDWQGPQQNAVYADTGGDIGFITPGLVPIRKRANAIRGLAPVPGWDDRYEWEGFIGFEDLPRERNPARGTIVTANNKITPNGYRYPFTYDWKPPYRARRIEALLGGRTGLTVDDMVAVQLDTRSLPVHELLPLMTAIPAGDPETSRVLAVLSGWDGDMSADRPEPLVFAAWWREFARRLYADELGDAFALAWDLRPRFVVGVLRGDGGLEAWCDNVSTPERETCAGELGAALQAALAALKVEHGGDPRRWRWGDAHYAKMEHHPFSRVPLLRPLFELRVPAPGDPYTVNAARFDPSSPTEPFVAVHGPTMRAVYDLADLNRSRFVQNSGQSGHMVSRHRRDLLERWRQGAYVEIRYDAVPDTGEVLTLVPAGAVAPRPAP